MVLPSIVILLLFGGGSLFVQGWLAFGSGASRAPADCMARMARALWGSTFVVNPADFLLASGLLARALWGSTFVVNPKAPLPPAEAPSASMARCNCTPLIQAAAGFTVLVARTCHQGKPFTEWGGGAPCPACPASDTAPGTSEDRTTKPPRV